VCFFVKENYHVRGRFTSFCDLPAASLKTFSVNNDTFAESSTALRNISTRLVQQTLRTVSIVFLTLLDFLLRSYIRSVHSNHSNRSNLTLQCSLV